MTTVVCPALPLTNQAMSVNVNTAEVPKTHNFFSKPSNDDNQTSWVNLLYEQHNLKSQCTAYEICLMRSLFKYTMNSLAILFKLASYAIRACAKLVRDKQFAARTTFGHWFTGTDVASTLEETEQVSIFSR